MWGPLLAVACVLLSAPTAALRLTRGEALRSLSTGGAALTLAPLAARWRGAPVGWQHWLWTDKDNRQLWSKHFPDMLAMYDAYPNPIQRADASRLLYMHVFGGVYAQAGSPSMAILSISSSVMWTGPATN